MSEPVDLDAVRELYDAGMEVDDYVLALIAELGVARTTIARLLEENARIQARQIVEVADRIDSRSNAMVVELTKALARVRDLTMDTDGNDLDPEFDGNTVGDIRAALDGYS